jgi:hypothetical protein
MIYLLFFLSLPGKICMCLGKDISIILPLIARQIYPYQDIYRSVLAIRGRKIDISLPRHLQIYHCNERK